MAQACVMVHPTLDATALPRCAATPAPARPLAADAGFITSTVRKRKDLREADDPAADKKPRQEGAGSPAPALQLAFAAAGGAGLLSPAPPPQLAECEGGGGAACGPAGDGCTLFSPVFHGHGLQKENQQGGAEPGAAAAAALARPHTPPADGASTDASTGTSASLDHVDSGSTATGCQAPAAAPAAAAAAAAAVPASPAPAAAPPPAEYADDEDDEFLEFDPFLFIKRLPPLAHCVPPRTTFLLPRQTRRSKQKTLVLDLDETLVHSTLDGDCVPDFTFPVDVGPVRHSVAVRKRPHLAAFLQRAAQLFEVVVFTASQRVYAEQLLDVIDPGRRLIRHRVYRDSCVLWEGNYLKDLTVLGRDLAHTLIVDNSPQAFGFQLDKGVPIESWYDDDGDTELLRLLPFLESVARADDVRPAIRAHFQLRKAVDASEEPRQQRQAPAAAQ
jgi:CTD small phosphatase-like protein 2